MRIGCRLLYRRFCCSLQQTLHPLSFYTIKITSPWPLLLAGVRGSSVRSFFHGSDCAFSDPRRPTLLYARPWWFFPPRSVRVISSRHYQNRFRKQKLQLFRDRGECAGSGVVQRLLPCGGTWPS